MMKSAHSFAASMLALFLSTVFACHAFAASTRVIFVAVSDNYQMGEHRLADGKVRGGFARLAAVIASERARGVPVIVAHAGDTLSPSLMSSLDRGAHIIALTNLIAPDIFVPGNHEFDFGKTVFLQRMSEATFPLFAANLRGPDGQPLPRFKDRTILTFDGVRIGLTGLTYDETPRASVSEDLVFKPTIETARIQAEALRREGADFVVSVVHSGRGQDYALNALGAFDLILSGHDHDLFINYDERSSIVESSYDAHQIVVVDATIDVAEVDGKRSMKWSPQFRIVDTATVTPDPKVAAAVAAYESEFTREMDVPLAKIATELDSRNSTVRTREAAIGNVIADAMRASSKADAAIVNGGTIRAGRIYAANTQITRRNIMEELPFGNRVVTVALTGKDLRKALEAGLQSLPNAAGRFPQVSGLTIEVEPSRPAGSRVVSVKVGSEVLDDTKLYTLAINDFLARGGDGYDMLRDAKKLLPVDDSPLIANEVMVHLRRMGTVTTAVEGRITFK